MIIRMWTADMRPTTDLDVARDVTADTDTGGPAGRVLFERTTPCQK